MKRIIDAARGLFSEATGTVRRGKALVVVCAVGAMIAGAFVVGTPVPSLTSEYHSWGDCNSKGGYSYCAWMCVLTGHQGADDCLSDGRCDCHC